MSYSADTFVADEQPTTAKWNKLWSNDAAFNDGTGIADAAILARHLGYGSVTPIKIAGDIANRTIYQSSVGDYACTTSFADVTHLTQPAITWASTGVALVIGTVFAQQSSATSIDIDYKVVCDGSDPNYPVDGVQRSTFSNATANNGVSSAICQVHTGLTAASHTFKLQAKTSSGTVNVRTGKISIVIIPLNT